MPTYNFYDTFACVYFSKWMSMSEKEQYLSDNLHVTQMPSSPGLHSGRGMGKPDDTFRDLLKEIKKQNSKGFYRSTVNTF